MSKLDAQGARLLALLVARLPSAIPNNPQTFITYKGVHDELGLQLRGPTYGESLKAQGLSNLAEWTAAENFPGVTGLIISEQWMMPGEGYFKLFHKSSEDFQWWEQQVILSKKFNWLPYLPNFELPLPPLSSDIKKPPERIEVITYRILRDSKISRRVKLLNDYECQICGHTITLPDGSKYAEAHHIRPLGAPHSGPDVADNVICLCPNHHAEMDYGVRPLALNDLKRVAGHAINEVYIKYHNETIFEAASDR